MSTRNTVLEAYKTCLENISTSSGFNTTVVEVTRKQLPYDKVEDFPTLMVISGAEEYEDLMGPITESDPFTIMIRGWVKNEDSPDNEIGKVLADVIKCLHSSNNTRRPHFKMINTTTDEGFFTSEVMEGLGYFVLTIEDRYQFERTNP